MVVDRYISEIKPNKILFVLGGSNLTEINFIGNDNAYFKKARLLKGHDDLQADDQGRISMNKELIEAVISEIEAKGYATITVS